MVAEAMGVLAAATIQGQFINKYRIAGECSDLNDKPSGEQLENQVRKYYIEILILTSHT